MIGTLRMAGQILFGIGTPKNEEVERQVLRLLAKGEMRVVDLWTALDEHFDVHLGYWRVTRVLQAMEEDRLTIRGHRVPAPDSERVRTWQAYALTVVGRRALDEEAERRLQREG